MDHKEIEWEGMDWLHLAQNGVQWRVYGNTTMNLGVPQNEGYFLTS